MWSLLFALWLFILPVPTLPPSPPPCTATVSQDITIFAKQQSVWSAVTWKTDAPCRLDFRLNINGYLAQIVGYTLDAPKVTCTQNAWSIACFGDISEATALDVQLQGLTILGANDAWLEDHTATWQRVWITTLQATFLPIQPVQ